MAGFFVSDEDSASVLDALLTERRAPRARATLDRSPRQSLLASRLLPAFQLSLRQADGCWLTVSPSTRAVRDWRLRILVAFVLSAALLMPLAWWMARRLYAPLKRMAREATRISLDDRGGPMPLEGALEVRMGGGGHERDAGTAAGAGRRHDPHARRGRARPAHAADRAAPARGNGAAGHRLG
jgi:hypothetical protein